MIKFTEKKCVFLPYLFFALLVILVACNSARSKPIFRVALAFDSANLPFRIVSKIGRRMHWDLRIIPDFSQRFRLLKSGDIDAIEWDIVNFYKHVTRQDTPDLIAFLPVKARYSVFAEPHLTPMDLVQNDKIIVGTDYLGVRSFLLDFWLKAGPKNTEAAATDQQVIQRLKDKKIHAAILENTVSTKEKLHGYTTLIDSRSAGPVVNVLVGMRATDHQYVKHVLLDYQRVIQKRDTICKDLQKFLPENPEKNENIPDYNTCLEKIPDTLYFSGRIFDSVERWIRLNQPIASQPLPYSRFFWLDN